MSFPFGPPQGFPAGGGGNQPVKVATGTATSTTVHGTFNYFNGATPSADSAYWYSLTLPVPSGANNLVFIEASVGANEYATIASPLGYVWQGYAASSALDTYGNYALASGADLSLTTASIVLPASASGSVYYFSVYYQ